MSLGRIVLGIAVMATVVGGIFAFEYSTMQREPKLGISLIGPSPIVAGKEQSLKIVLENSENHVIRVVGLGWC